jgi:hypothetical protein
MPFHKQWTPLIVITPEHSLIDNNNQLKTLTDVTKMQLLSVV